MKENQENIVYVVDFKNKQVLMVVKDALPRDVETINQLVEKLEEELKAA
ncbi:MAG TPA: hypothetical protein VI911_12095 [Patescibacteria group bacterium]|nr:hypothetical protein [Patescibacteria group bacterium]